VTLTSPIACSRPNRSLRTPVAARMLPVPVPAHGALTHVAASTRPVDSQSDWPLGGVVWPRRVVRFARLIQRLVRALGGACGPRRFRRQSQPDLAITQASTTSAT
jgi:hypothetical protein